jgi:superoxide dismutase
VAGVRRESWPRPSTFRNARPKYIDTFLEKLVNWEFALKNLQGA